MSAQDEYAAMQEEAAKPRADEEAAETDHYRYEKARRGAIRRLDEEEFAAALGARPKRTGREFAARPPVPVLMDRVLAADANLLAGPKDAGKSLLARDWSLGVASGKGWREFAVPERRNVLWIASENTHDFAERWESQPLWSAAADGLWVLDEPVNLPSRRDVSWLLDEYGEQRPGLVVFDVIYGMGLGDDNSAKDVGQVIAAMKRISKAWDAATLALGHPGLKGERRIRGSSAWGQQSPVEWHLADGLLTCEKTKIANLRELTRHYRPEYPALRWLDGEEVLGDLADRVGTIAADFADHPDEPDAARARRLGPKFGLGDGQTRKLIREWKKAQK